MRRKNIDKYIEAVKVEKEKRKRQNKIYYLIRKVRESKTRVNTQKKTMYIGCDGYEQALSNKYVTDLIKTGYSLQLEIV